ncbi:MAG: hypothetical protein WC455_16300 [Dehalococcoidia bacterium]|jgi:arginine utilization protein RocB
MKRFHNEVLLGYNGKPVSLPIQNKKEDYEFKTTDLFWLLGNSAPYKTLNDSAQGMRLAKALEAAADKDVIEIEDAVHDWLKGVAKELCPPIFKQNGVILYDYISEKYIKD